MDWAVFSIAIFVAISSTMARPNEYNGDLRSGGVVEYRPADEDQPMTVDVGERERERVSLLDTEYWKELLAQGRVQEMINAIQRALGSNRQVRIRTQWGGPDTDDVGNNVRNTVNWNAFKGDKTNLNVIMDSTFSRNRGKVDMINPSVGINFQMKY